MTGFSVACGAIAVFRAPGRIDDHMIPLVECESGGIKEIDLVVGTEVDIHHRDLTVTGQEERRDAAAEAVTEQNQVPSIALQRVLDGQQGLGAGEIHIVGVQVVEVVPVVDVDLLVLLHAEDLGSVRHGTAQDGHGLTGQAERRLAVVHAPEILPALVAVVGHIVHNARHGVGQLLGHLPDLLLPPMAVCAVVIGYTKCGSYIDILEIRKVFFEIVK